MRKPKTKVRLYRERQTLFGRLASVLIASFLKMPASHALDWDVFEWGTNQNIPYVVNQSSFESDFPGQGGNAVAQTVFAAEAWNQGAFIANALTYYGTVSDWPTDCNTKLYISSMAGQCEAYQGYAPCEALAMTTPKQLCKSTIAAIMVFREGKGSSGSWMFGDLPKSLYDIDFWSVMTHEMGHVLDLDHDSGSYPSVMKPSLWNYTWGRFPLDADRTSLWKHHTPIYDIRTLVDVQSSWDGSFFFYVARWWGHLLTANESLAFWCRPSKLGSPVLECI